VLQEVSKLECSKLYEIADTKDDGCEMRHTYYFGYTWQLIFEPCQSIHLEDVVRMNLNSYPPTEKGKEDEINNDHWQAFSF
jgi:hypothetical protein